MKQPIIRAKRPHVKVKNCLPPRYIALVSSKLVTVCEENQNLPK